MAVLQRHRQRRAAAEQSAGQRYDATMSSEVNAMLAQTLGAGKAQVVVNANLNANQATEDSLLYAKTGIPLTQQTSTEALKGSGAAGAGAREPRATSPAYTGTGAGGANSNYNNKTSNTTFGVDKTVTHSVIAPGAIQQQSVSVSSTNRSPPPRSPRSSRRSPIRCSRRWPRPSRRSIR